MKFVDEFRNGALASKLAQQIARLSAGCALKIMEVCGGHTHTIFRYGIEEILPPNVEMIHGPGCPVCVIPLGRVDDAIAIARTRDVIFTSYGDMLRVPGSKESLLDAKADGADVRIVYSPLDALKIARKNPDRRVVFFAVGFETTAPATALTLLQARDQGLENFSLYCNHVTVSPAIKAILDSPDQQIDGFVGPGHVSTVIGTRPYEFIARDYGKPIATAGFEPLDILQAVYMVVKQLAECRVENEIQYTRAVVPEGNARAEDVVSRTMQLRPFFEWRGLGSIPCSGLELRPEFAGFDAERLFALRRLQIADPKVCQCGEVLRGAIKPYECKVFGTTCTPETPIGTCMVSSEGACAAYYNYGRHHRAERSAPASAPK